MKKEYEKPGQTRETPSEVGLLLEAHTSYACLVPQPVCIVSIVMVFTTGGETLQLHMALLCKKVAAF